MKGARHIATGIAAGAALAAALAACAPSAPPAGPTSSAPRQPGPASESPDGEDPATIVEDVAALEKLRGNSGITLQWISWDYRGELDVMQPGDTVYLNGGQVARDGSGRSLSLKGRVVRIGSESFIFDGRIVMRGTHLPETDACVREGPVEFLITKNRKYWRMQDFVQCDGLTDYVDIYF